MLFFFFFRAFSHILLPSQYFWKFVTKLPANTSPTRLLHPKIKFIDTTRSAITEPSKTQWCLSHIPQNYNAHYQRTNDLPSKTYNMDSTNFTQNIVLLDKVLPSWTEDAFLLQHIAQHQMLLFYLHQKRGVCPVFYYAGCFLNIISSSFFHARKGNYERRLLLRWHKGSVTSS